MAAYEQTNVVVESWPLINHQSVLVYVFFDIRCVLPLISDEVVKVLVSGTALGVFSHVHDPVSAERAQRIRGQGIRVSN